MSIVDPRRPHATLRLLLTFVGGMGHLAPLVPFARALQTAGHTVAFGCGSAMARSVEAAGFVALPLETSAGRSPERLPLRAVDREREEGELRDRFIRHAARDRAPRLAALARSWRPDVLVCDETDFGAMLAAERLGLPHATVLVAASGAFVRAETVGEELAVLRAEHGLAREPGLTMSSRHLVLSPFPACLRDPAHPLPATAHAFRVAGGGPPEGGHTAPPTSADRPAIYLTLGTVFNTESGDLLARAVSGLRDLAAELVVATGPGLDPAELGPQPRHVRVERHVAQEDVIQRSDLVVSHGGSGTVLGALARGLPSVLLPLGADQPLNADRCEALGVARVLDVAGITAACIRDAAASVLADPAYRLAAERVRDEIDALPSPVAAVPLLERLARGETPILRG